ncbi:MAG: glycoside hydrolase family 65 protein [Lactococcus raffinolactis]|jgi:maltose phosphorylase|uniref:Glycoside hydrolase family 65 protein n=1 Tax=Pseudolactococcus raffinolactis TaxID=1366 RepID=A0A290Q703_9LACT|nr:glycoside hydrolase family 65 protein [Lactococcus raffinolactis]MBP6300691.1 glycoside hydrolase family 65 protein [Lactococcus sp.]ATC62006.1 family 65 glycosyl hydrolase [Lactococcus raffinolactis]MBR2542613.1 glycoside hydrolase family 65 protein [Lactococcus sp.]MBW9331685.1 glycoside hydrolase family 65 protein [Lactococcus raffinolactis]MDN5414552.1 glycoside hydrolase family 65 protein [Lactococcus raffinolactis]
MNQIKRIMAIDPWQIKSDTLEIEDRRLQESLTAIGNGYMGMRGNFAETYSGDMHQGFYLAGVWYPDKTRVGWWKNGYPEYFGKAINALNIAKIKLVIDGAEVDLATESISDFNISLDMAKGTLSYTYVVRGVKVSAERFFSADILELAVFAFMFETVDGQDHKIQIDAIIDADVKNEDANYDEQFWNILDKGQTNNGSYIATQTIENPFGVDQFTVVASQTFAGNFEAVGQTSAEKTIFNSFEQTVTVGDVLTFEKRVVVTTSRDYADLAEVKAGNQAIVEKSVQTQDYNSLYQAQVAAWGKRWDIADVVIEGSDEAQQGIRFNLFQLFSTYYGEDERLNIGPKGFTGEKYGGATYWDTEAYAVPLYLSLADEKVTKNLLKYRRQQLPQAQHNARQQGLKGALYPMVTFTGVECHNEWEITFEEIHRNGAIPYAIYNYTNYTGDETYLAHEGLDVLVEVARFWADRVHYSARNDKYMIHGVTGPNEYENNINNNWYTNTLAAWVLSYTSESLAKHSRADLNVTAEELAKWSEIVDKMYYPYDEKEGVFVQHDGFMDKDLRPVSALDATDLPLNQNWSWDKILRSPFIKQADVLQGIYFFGNQFSLEEKRRNFDFYEPMTVHESSLSPSIHAILAAELGKEAKAVEMYGRTARLDLDNYNNDTEDGLHITSMTGSWLAIVQGFAQMKTWDGKLSFAPFLPSDWTGYTFHINYRGRLLKIEVTENVTVSLLSGEALNLEVYGQSVELTSSYTVKVGG